MTRRIFLASTATVAALLLPLAAQKGPSPGAHNGGTSSAQKSEKQAPDKGELVFKQNCSRCHEAPQSFSPRITGTIARHMRVRASLSAEDEKALLHYLNP